MAKNIDFFFEKEGPWQACMQLLREIILSIPELEEDLKWGQACYTLGKANIVLIHGFKEYCALLLFKGALLPDPEAILIQQTENVQSARQIRFTSITEIRKQKAAIKRYIKNAIDVERSGAKMPKRSLAELQLPEELVSAMKQMPELKAAFDALSPGRQRAYALHFSDAKQVKTRMSRIEKHVPNILAGKGLHD